MNSIKSSLQVIVLLSMVITLSGCWDNKDINHRTLPLVMAISKQNDEYKVILQDPELDQNMIKLNLISETGKTISQAVDKISMNKEKQIDLFHIKVILIEKKLAQQGLKDIIAGFMRNGEISLKAYVVICDEEIEKYLANEKKTTVPKQAFVYDFFEKNAGWNPQIARAQIWQIYRSIYSYTNDIAIPIIKSGQSSPCDYIGSSVIRNGKMVEQITSDETLLYNAFNKESTQGKIEVMDHASVLIVSNSMKYNSELVDNKPYMHTQIKLKVVVLETKGNPSQTLIIQELEKLITERFQMLFSKIQKSEADILGIGQRFRTIIPRKDLQNWRTEYYPQLKMELQFHTDIQNEGLIKMRSNLTK
ncbi:Ger(x)C family spore germination protein [Paenibacillus sp. CGMCC 1.16610]|uniref:Ger(X)C family spore germination protein n=1 Tax=Paenibacillus anseongense TaxID=2682845 RepID=A0ABW9UPT3_9BACL|nr:MULTISPECIES: Ger(x)C family spore germination protein [Paenibacillus]MBA2941111.1 Ger(x)C family spore germination protein [Paenibacillus sp. CGMCC 1.16610]MVQ39930.1 Ger(x)C family spore germination protein [Paenibacillus anseongense]